MKDIKGNKKNLLTCYKETELELEIGIDEVGRGPLFGRVYSAAVILPKTPDFKFELLKDSKKFTSRKKIKEVSDYIKSNVPNYSIAYEDEKTIGKINIKNACHNAMHKAIRALLSQSESMDTETKADSKSDYSNYILLVDGNNFKPFIYFNNTELKQINHITIEGGDNIYCSIAAASILAKVDHDKYIEELCTEYPKLHEYYDLNNNKGYGTKRHIEGIKKYGISPWHRTSYGCCKTATLNNDDFYL